MAYVFISHHSACEALRTRGLEHPLWPSHPRSLPLWGDCIATQRGLAQFIKENDLAKLGIVTRPIDILVPNKQYRHKGKVARTHPWSGTIPSQSMLRMESNVVVSGPEFVLLQLANVRLDVFESHERSLDRFHEDRDAYNLLGIADPPPFEDFRAWDRIAAAVRLALIAMEFMGSYRLPLHENGKPQYGCEQLTDLKRTRKYLESIPADHGYRRTTAFRQLRLALPLVLERAASPMETRVALMLTAPIEMGGYGLPKPKLNAHPRRADNREVRADMLWEDASLAVEYDSDEFHGSAGVDKTNADIERANALRSAGYTVFEITPGIVLDPRRMANFANQLARALGIVLVGLDHELRFRRDMLHRTLFGL